MSEPRAMTKQEMADRFLKTVVALARYWATVPAEKLMPDQKPEYARVSGMAFSMLSILDGCNMGLPAFNLVPVCDEGDRDYMARAGENWWQEIAINDETTLHAIFQKMEQDIEEMAK